MRSTSFRPSAIPGVPSATQHALFDMDRTEFIRSQMTSYPEYADKIAAEMFDHPGEYPIFERARIHTGFEEGPNGAQYPTFRPGELHFKGWMDAERYAVYTYERQRRRERELTDG
jgi:hypothetical protein